MQRIKYIIRRATLYLMIVMLAGGSPMVALADDTSTTKPSDTYTYDATTKHWNSTKWVWDSNANKYVPFTVPSPPPDDTKTSTPASTDKATPASTDKATPATDTAVVTPAPSDATIVDNTNAAATTNDNTGATVTNKLNSDAATGDAGVTKNTTAGDATTGDASGATTIVNSVHSTVGSGDTAGVATFTTNLYGNITGDITIGPAINNATIDKNTNLSSATNVNNNDSLTNNQTLSANSGNATVSGNTKAGSAKSGNANTVADVLNLINTIVAANKSFIGTINIYGNLNGDILVSPDFIPQLLASNANASVYGNYTMPLSTTTNDNQSIVNNVKLNATTGTATVQGNTSAGSATTGAAKTNLTILNLTGHKVDAKKSLLVFVNVLGKWVGMIVDAPGATSAALGSGVISDNTTISDTNNLNNHAAITNNLDLSSASGDATVASNTSAGGATTGDATASANIANISTSEFKLSDWFGVLFINVFGTWIGSFGVDTAAGTVVPLSGIVTPPPVHGAPNLRFGFTPLPHTGTTVLSASGGAGPDSGGSAFGTAAMANGAHSAVTRPTLIPAASPHEDPLSLIMMVTGFTIAGGSGILWMIQRWAALRTAAA